MSKFTTIDDVALTARIERLKRETQDLRERVAKRVSAVEREGRWLKSDPLYQSLWFVLAGVQCNLRSAECELLRRASALSLDHAAKSTVNAEHAWHTRLSNRNIRRLAQLWKHSFLGKPAYQS